MSFSMWQEARVRFLDGGGGQKLLLDEPGYLIVEVGLPTIARNRQAAASRWMDGDLQTSTKRAPGVLTVVVLLTTTSWADLLALTTAVETATDTPGGVEVRLGDMVEVWACDEATAIDVSATAYELASFYRTVTVTLPVQPSPLRSVAP